jgi:hypothetical protein
MTEQVDCQNYSNWPENLKTLVGNLNKHHFLPFSLPTSFSTLSRTTRTRSSRPLTRFCDKLSARTSSTCSTPASFLASQTLGPLQWHPISTILRLVMKLCGSFYDFKSAQASTYNTLVSRTNISNFTHFTFMNCLKTFNACLKSR